MDLREARAAVSGRRHPWEVARARFIFDRVRRLAPSADHDGPTVLDFGSGDAFVATSLCDAMPRLRIDCVDPGYTARELAAYASLRPARMRVSDRIPEHVYDLLLCLDVLEHLDDDLMVLRDLVCTRLKPGGAVLITAPAVPGLFCSHDRALGHHRRYTAATLRRLAERAGLSVEASGGLFLSLLPARALRVAAERAMAWFQPRAARPGWLAQPQIVHTALPTVIAGALDRILTAETAVEANLATAGLRLPGLSLWLLGRRT